MSNAIVDSIKEDISNGEGSCVEFKATLPSEDRKYLKTAVAFSNGVGGRILLGVADDKSIVGIPDDTLFSTEDAVADALYNACSPSIVPEIYHVTIDDKTVVVVDIRPGQDTPYRIKSEGDRGIYIRVSGTTRTASENMVKSLQIRGAKTSFDFWNALPARLSRMSSTSCAAGCPATV